MGYQIFEYDGTVPNKFVKAEQVPELSTLLATSSKDFTGRKRCLSRCWAKEVRTSNIVLKIRFAPSAVATSMWKCSVRQQTLMLGVVDAGGVAMILLDQAC